VHPFGRKGKAEAGVKATLRNIDNDYLVEEQDADGAWAPLADFNNHFIFTENIYAGYLIVGNQRKRFSWQAGVRSEYSDVTTELTETDTTNNRTYIDFFPSAHLSYKLDSAANSLQLSYSRRLSRPHFRHLLPFYGYSDSRNFFSGNPDLEPEYSHLFEVGHLYQFDRGSILSSVYYRYSTGVIERITLADENGFTRIFPINLSTRNAVGVEFSFNYEIARWWNINGNFNLYNSTTEGSYENQALRSESDSWSARGATKFSILRKTDFQVSIRYDGPSNTTQGRTLSRYEVRAGMTRDILKGNGTITISGRDLFNTRKRRSITETETLYSESEFQWRSRQVVLSFTYRLKQNKRQQRPMGDEGGGDDAGF
jgi:outer membrane receptor protein involved in Fe transport